jgi:hypothetical protein
VPQSITIAAFAFGAILLLIALLGGGFKLFGAEISGTTGRTGRGVAGILGIVFLAFGIYGSIDSNRSRRSTPNADSSTDNKDAPNVGGRHSLAELLRGIWTSEDVETRGVTKLVVLRKGPDVFVHAWGKCHPQDCDWGEAKATIEENILKVTWYWEGGERDMSIRLDGSRLRTETVHVYKDNRPPRTSSEIFRRGT